MLRLWLPGQLMVGAWVSFTVIRKVQVLVRPTPSVAFNCTTVMPFGKAEPLGMLPFATLTEPPDGQLSTKAGMV